MEITLVVA